MANIKSSTPTRRAVVTGTVAALTIGTAVNAIAAEADPILAVIERHRTAYLAWISTLQNENELEDAIPQDRRRSYRIMDESTIFEGDDPRWIANVEREADASADADDAATDMTNVRPTTMAGLIALLDYIEAFNRGALRTDDCCSEWQNWPDDAVEDDVMPWAFWVMRNVQAALQAIGGVA